jgi:hypothetical protein
MAFPSGSETLALNCTDCAILGYSDTVAVITGARLPRHFIVFRLDDRSKASNSVAFATGLLAKVGDR